MNDDIKVEIDASLYKKYGYIVHDMWFSENWSPVKVTNNMEAAYYLIMQKVVCEDIIKMCHETGNKKIYNYAVNAMKDIEHNQDIFLHNLSLKNRCAYLLLLINISREFSSI